MIRGKKELALVALSGIGFVLYYSMKSGYFSTLQFYRRIPQHMLHSVNLSRRFISAFGDIKQAYGIHKRLVVITDFDRTLTKPFSPADPLKPCPQGHEIIFGMPLLSQPFRSSVAPLAKIAENPPAFRTHLAMQSFSEWWWEKAHYMFVHHKLTHTDIARGTLECDDVELRSSCADLVALTESHNVQIIILSAGVTNVIEHLWERDAIDITTLKNVHVISNKLLFDEKGECVGVHPPTPINWLNKQQTLANFAAAESQLQVAEVLAAVSRGVPVILVGDSLADARVLDLLDTHGPVLRIGFLNSFDNTQQQQWQLDKYLAEFDVVIGPNVETFEFVNHVIQEVLSV
eukprot:c1000_g1_i1.p1 GENE.c1000_g1_i1~~c1000_g1_i1.p1  ORF type:complete len:346 (+),score=90.05 c1000_g1_i1:71-1108(+)